MRRLLWSGLCLSLGLVATQARADDPWRPTRRGTETPALGQAPPRSQGLLRPVPLDEGPQVQQAVTPASYSPTVPDQPRPLVRAKPFEQPQPMPPGPLVPGGVDPGSAKSGGSAVPAEPIAPPKGSPEVWGNVVSRWSDGQAGFSNGGGVPLGVATDCGASCGVACAEPACHPILGLFKRRWLGADCGVCSDNACPSFCDDPCAPRCFIYGRAEYLLWWIKGNDVPPLMTASPVGTARENTGVLGQPSTVVLFGGNEIDYGPFSGGRFTLGFCLPNHPDCSFETTYFFLGGRSVNFLAGSGGAPNLARPIVNALNGNEESQLVAFPGVVVGSAGVRSDSKLWGIEGNFRKPLYCGCEASLDWLCGFRYLELNESLDIVEDLNVVGTNGVPAGTRIGVADSFHTRNNFYGGQLGLEGERRFGRWSLGGFTKVGLGVMRQTVSINGATSFSVPGAGTTVERGGILALPTNIGQSESSKFAVVPEVGVRLGYQLTEGLRLFVGYNFLYVSSVARPGDQIDRAINKTQIPTAFGQSQLQGTPRPMPLFQSSDFWAQGVNFGLELRY